eukprot:TRINITY_DN9785_c0_g1_i4.p1 TRINITY_DN9785_c0_g1~~TRINITY_DN9785_c0_g1_i4.p1  ORF type:complete len:333 (+),score=53.17 TRINITY_DN9785_c0_g1_i4:41-1000(+)
MDNLGYAAEEIVAQFDLPQDVSGHPRWRKIWRISLLVICGITFLCFCGYQGWITWQSYHHPTWSSYEEEREQIPFPGVLVCPGTAGKLDPDLRILSHGDCLYYSGNDTTIIEECHGMNVTLVAQDPAKSDKSKTQICLNYNMNHSMMALDSTAFLILTVNIKLPDPRPAKHPLMDRRNWTYPLYAQLYSQGHIIASDSLFVPNILFSMDSSNYVILSRTEYTYLNGSTNSDFTAIASSTPNSNTNGVQLMLWLSFTSNRVTVWQQVVNYDIITVIGILAGALGFWRAFYTIVNLIVDKIHKKCVAPPDDDDQEGGASLD